MSFTRRIALSRPPHRHCATCPYVWPNSLWVPPYSPHRPYPLSLLHHRTVPAHAALRCYAIADHASAPPLKSPSPLTGSMHRRDLARFPHHRYLPTPCAPIPSSPAPVSICPVLWEYVFLLPSYHVFASFVMSKCNFRRFILLQWLCYFHIKVSSENLAGVFLHDATSKDFCCYIWSMILHHQNEFFATITLQICIVIVAGGSHRFFFLLWCYISTKKLLRRLRRGLWQNHFAKKIAMMLQ
jgi:hypothetical protein